MTPRQRLLKDLKSWLEKNIGKLPKDSLIETAKAYDLEPYDYLHHVLRHIAVADTVEKLEALLPWNIKKRSVENRVS